MKKESKATNFFAIIFCIILFMSGAFFPALIILLSLANSGKQKNKMQNDEGLRTAFGTLKTEAFSTSRKFQSSEKIKMKEHFADSEYRFMPKTVIPKTSSIRSEANDELPYQRFMEYAKMKKGLNPDEFLELIHSFDNEFTHDIFHEANGSSHFESGICMIYNSAKGDWYVGHSADLLRKIEKMLKGQIRNEIFKAYRDGESLWIKILPLEGSPCSNIFEMERWAMSAFGAQKL